MRLKPEECQKLAKKAGEKILADPQNVFKVPKAKILEAIEGRLRMHFEEERQIEDEADRLYQEQGDQFQGIQKSKAVQMLRAQLAKEKDFTLSGGPLGRMSPDKVMHIAHLVADKLYDDDLMDFPDEDDGPKVFKKIFQDYFSAEDAVGEKVRAKIQSLSNPPFEGSREWETLFRKYSEEEMRRLGH
jgi:hypothetical protein